MQKIIFRVFKFFTGRSLQCTWLYFQARKVWWREPALKKRLRKGASIRHDERRVRFYKCFFFQGFLRCLGFRLLFLRLFITCHTRLHFISSLLCRKSSSMFFDLFTDRSLQCTWLYLQAWRGWWREPALKNAYEKARQFDTMSVECVFTNVFSSRVFYGVSVSACFFYACL